MHGEVNLTPRAPWWRTHWPAACILALAAILIFARLGADYLWSDEGDTAVLARSILKFGVPTAWDGVTFTDSDFGARVNEDLVMVSHPWLPYYLTAASFALVGESTLAARLPFALCGLATVWLVYLMVFRVTGHRWTAASAALLLTLSVQFLIYARQSRYYSLHALLACLLVLQFSRLNSWRNSALFAVIAILLFHSHPIAIAPVLGLALLTVVHPSFRDVRPWFWRAMPIIVLFTLPWLLMAQSGYARNSILTSDPSRLLFRMGQFAIECASVTSMVGAVALGAMAWRRRQSSASPRAKRAAAPAGGLFAPAEGRLVAALLASIAAYALPMALTQGRDEIYSMGVRYAPAVIPFMAVVTALLIAKASRGQWRMGLALVLVFGFTKMGQLTPWTFWERPLAKRDPASNVTFHNPARAIDRVLQTEQGRFVESLVHENPGTTARIVEFLRSHASRRDVVVTNFDWEPLYFHTGLAQGLTVLSSYPIYKAAKAHGLPDYVFSADGARWIVWRQAWGPYRGQALDRVLAQLESARVPVTLVARIPETLWENRENIHFRRYPGNNYVYPWYGAVPDALIYRVDWPGVGGQAAPVLRR